MFTNILKGLPIRNGIRSFSIIPFKQNIINGLPQQNNILMKSIYPSISNVIQNNNLSKLICSREAHTKTKGDEELVTFLNEEIMTEKKVEQKVTNSLDQFDVTFEESVLTFTKKFNDEKVVITLNVNHTVDAIPNEDKGAAQGQQTEDSGDMRSQPRFDVDVVKNGQTLTFSCSYTMEDGEATENQEEYNDVFVIDEVSLYEGEAKDSTYAVAGEILDGYLYDLFMNMLEERGVTNDFAEKLSAYCTAYEHSLYVKMLQNLQNFVKSS